MSTPSPGELWEKLGGLDELDAMQVLTSLFTTYETLLENDPHDEAVRRFFHHLAQTLERVAACNLNRR